MTLSELQIGQEAEITAVGGDLSYRRRLLELGLLPGTLVKVLRVAPLGDPLELRARGSALSLRKAEASSIVVSAR